jgi:hypothetical protein
MPWDATQLLRRVEPGVADNSLVVENDGKTGRGSPGPMLEEICSEKPDF